MMSKTAYEIGQRGVPRGARQPKRGEPSGPYRTDRDLDGAPEAADVRITGAEHPSTDEVQRTNPSAQGAGRVPTGHAGRSEEVVTQATGQDDGVLQGDHPRTKGTEGTEATVGRVKDVLDISAQEVGTSTVLTIGSRYVDPTVSTPASYAGGMAAPFASGIAAGAGLASGIKALREAQSRMDGHPVGSTAHREAFRDVASARAEVAQAASGLVGNLLNGAGGALNFGGQAPVVYNAVLSAGGAATLPGSLLQTGRFARKAAKAQARVLALRELMFAETAEPENALEAARQEVAAWQELKNAVHELYAASRAAYEARAEEMDRSPQDRLTGGDRNVLDQAWAELQEIALTLREVDRGLMEATTRQREHQGVVDSMDTALGEAAQEVEPHRPGAPQYISLRTIQEYALHKNERGRIKKIVAATGGALGTGGAVASLVASGAVAAGATAGAGALLATPVGWALAGAGAAAGLGLGSYKAWKFFAKRWEQTAGLHTGGETVGSVPARLGKSLVFWKKLGPGKREAYAAALYDMADGDPGADPVRVEEARRTIAALGLDWDDLRMKDELASAVELIASKLAS
ncbi:hypothetical protein [Streptomyces sp. NPDC007856]|uniref:hypothetical protein n=1 Tax=Streptomyces sp. NPDC007856 TaxID=3364781 RepID=UPI0036CDA253